MDINDLDTQEEFLSSRGALRRVDGTAKWIDVEYVHEDDDVPTLPPTFDDGDVNNDYRPVDTCDVYLEGTYVKSLTFKNSVGCNYYEGLFMTLDNETVNYRDILTDDVLPPINTVTTGSDYAELSEINSYGIKLPVFGDSVRQDDPDPVIVNCLPGHWMSFFGPVKQVAALFFDRWEKEPQLDGSDDGSDDGDSDDGDLADGYMYRRDSDALDEFEYMDEDFNFEMNYPKFANLCIRALMNSIHDQQANGW